jgi:hypothetical protein
MSLDPRGPLERAPIRIGEIWENPMTRERVTIVEPPHQNPEGRAVAEVIARVGARVAGEHRHPKMVERFTVLDGELTVKRARAFFAKERTATDVWHDWWNATEQDVLVRVETTPGERFINMIQSFFSLARAWHADAGGTTNLLKLACGPASSAT